MTKRDSEYQWDLFGKTDPYYGVLTSDKFKKENIDENAIKDFFEYGQNYIDFVIRTIRNHLDDTFQPDRCLDFGCGVGRLVIPLSPISNSVLGVDVSESMLKEAQKNCHDRYLENVEFIKPDDQLSNISGTFNFINSFIVFQHIPRRRGEYILTKLIKLLAENGIGALHFTYYVNQKCRILNYARKIIPHLYNVMNLIKGRDFNYPYMELNYYKFNKLLKILQDNNCNNCYIRFTNHPNMLGVILFFQKKEMSVL
jgi:SAM-dependent methyltransferase